MTQKLLIIIMTNNKTTEIIRNTFYLSKTQKLSLIRMEDCKNKMFNYDYNFFKNTVEFEVNKYTADFNYSLNFSRTHFGVGIR